jgi:hypothetical protein
VRSEADLAAVEQAGCEGAVVGRALLDGRLALQFLFRRPEEPEASAGDDGFQARMDVERP